MYIYIYIYIWVPWFNVLSTLVKIIYNYTGPLSTQCAYERFIWLFNDEVILVV